LPLLDQGEAVAPDAPDWYLHKLVAHIDAQERTLDLF
jgi:hypothetical protein